MLTPEEVKVLTYLRRRLQASLADVARACFGGADLDWLGRVASSLDWFGYVTLYPGPDGNPIALEITDKGLQQLR
jgi:hypothetical protein